MEEWRKVERFRRIEVSNLGNVRTVWEHKVKNLKPMEMKTTVGSYLKVSVTDVETGKQRQIGIHNLVAEAFIEIPEDRKKLKLEPNHRDGNKHNNVVKNLEWKTRGENLQHAIDTGLRPSTWERPDGTISRVVLALDKAKPVKATNTITGEEYRTRSAKEMSEITGIPARTIQYNAFNRKSKSPVKDFLFEKDE